MKMFFLTFLFYSFSISSGAINKIDDLLISSDSISDQQLKSLKQKKIYHKRCSNSIKCKKLYHLRKVKKDQKNNVLSSDRANELFSELQAKYQEDGDIDHLIHMLSDIVVYIDVKNIVMQRKFYTLGINLYNIGSYNHSVQVFTIGYNKYKDEINGYYFLLGLMKSKKGLIKDKLEFSKNVCDFFSKEKSVSIGNFMKFNHDYRRVISSCGLVKEN